jgi:hypothetical protein
LKPADLEPFNPHRLGAMRRSTLSAGRLLVS